MFTKNDNSVIIYSPSSVTFFLRWNTEYILDNESQWDSVLFLDLVTNKKKVSF